jgi:hypothetical protein
LRVCGQTAANERSRGGHKEVKTGSTEVEFADAACVLRSNAGQTVKSTVKSMVKSTVKYAVKSRSNLRSDLRFKYGRIPVESKVNPGQIDGLIMVKFRPNTGQICNQIYSLKAD